MKTYSKLTSPVRDWFQTNSRNLILLSGISSTLLMILNLTLEADWLRVVGIFLGCSYIFLLIFELARGAPQADDLPDFHPLIRADLTYRQMLVIIILAAGAVFTLTAILLQNGWFMVLFSVLLALGMLVRYRRQITRRMVGIGFLTGLVVALVETLLNADLIMALLSIPLAISGAMLLSHTQLTQWQALTGRWGKAIKSFAWGCLLAVPPALLNIVFAQSAEEAVFDQQFEHWWQAFYALQPGIVEEVWARLFLTTLLYALLRPTQKATPQKALIASMGLATLLHGLAHYPQSLADPFSAIFITLMYGVPLVLLYVKRDLEQAIAYHFFIDFVRFLSSALI